MGVGGNRAIGHCWRVDEGISSNPRRAYLGMLSERVKGGR